MAMRPPKPVLVPTQQAILETAVSLWRQGATPQQLAEVLDVQEWVLTDYLMTLRRTDK
jgi:hypothetical protein